MHCIFFKHKLSDFDCQRATNRRVCRYLLIISKVLVTSTWLLLSLCRGMVQLWITWRPPQPQNQLPRLRSLLSQAHPQTHPPAGPSSSAVPAAPSAPPGWGCTPGRWCPPSPRRRARPPAASAGRCPGSRWDSWLRDESRQEKNFELSEKLLQPVETGSNLFRRPYQNVTRLWCCVEGYRRGLWGRLPASSRGCLGPDTCWRTAASTTGTTSDSQRQGRLSARHTGHAGRDWERTGCPVSSCLNAFSSTQCSLTL